MRGSLGFPDQRSSRRNLCKRFPRRFVPGLHPRGLSANDQPSPRQYGSSRKFRLKLFI